jgi:hypothetical protein
MRRNQRHPERSEGSHCDGGDATHRNHVMLNEVKDLAVTFRSSLCFAEEAELHSA